MAETSEALRQIFEKIRDEAERALKLTTAKTLDLTDEHKSRSIVAIE
jgi:hypothetical protein